MNSIKFTLTLLMIMAVSANPVLASKAVATPESITHPGGEISSQLCLSSIASSITSTEDIELFLNPVLVGADAAVIGGSIALAIPTALASLPAAAVVLAARNVGAATFKEAKISSQERAKQIVLDSLVYLQSATQNRQENISSYPALQELVARVNGPVNTLVGRGYTAKEVATMVVKASHDKSFCSDPSNHRLVHFKDYVLTNIGS